MTKQEEILNNHVSLYFSSHHDKSQYNGEGEHGGAEWHTHKAIAADIYKAMDVFGKHQTVQFTNWTTSAECNYSCSDEDQWNNIHNPHETITSEQLYDKFIQWQIEQQNKP